jgi:hypothetical protein
VIVDPKETLKRLHGCLPWSRECKKFEQLKRSLTCLSTREQLNQSTSGPSHARGHRVRRTLGTNAAEAAAIE